MIKKTLIFIVFLMILPLTLANGEYTNLGGNDSQYKLGRGIFSILEELETSFFSSSLPNAKTIPLIDDLNNDGKKEIIVIDGDDVEIYHNKELNFNTSHDFGTNQRVSYPIIFDIDGDGNKEYIFVREEEEYIEILSYNGTLTNKSSVSLSGLNYVSGETMIACKGVNDCLIVYSENINSCQGVLNCNDLSVSKFNITNVGSGLILAQNGGTSSNDNGGFCRSSVPHINVVDYDKDGITEYVFSFSAVDEIQASVSDAGIYLFWIEAESSTPTVEHSVFQDEETENGAFDSDGAFSCATTGYGDRFSSPLMSESFLNDPGYELVYAFQSELDEYQIDLYDKDYINQQSFPLGDNSDGVLVSNPFTINVFSDTSVGKDFCVVGFNTLENQQVLTCGSSGRSGFDTSEYVYEIEDNYNNTFTYSIANTVSHSAQQSNALTNSIDLNEFLTTYGIFSVDESSCSNTCPNCITGAKNICTANREFQNGVGKSALISIDLENVGNEDLLALSTNAMFLLDDGVSNEGVNDIQVLANPCPTDSFIKINSTIQLTVTATDGNSLIQLPPDLLDVTATIYQGDSNQQTETRFNVTSGSPEQFTFIANKTGTNKIIKVTATDNVNPSVSVSQTFNVGNNGLEFGDSTCSFGITVDDDEDEGILTPEQIAQQNNTITQSVNQIGDVFGFGVTGLGKELVWLVLMIIVAGVVLLSPTFFNPNQANAQKSNPMFALIGVGVVEILMLILGVKLGFIGVGIIITIVVLALILIGLYLKKMFTSDSGGM